MRSSYLRYSLPDSLFSSYQYDILFSSVILLFQLDSLGVAPSPFGDVLYGRDLLATSGSSRNESGFYVRNLIAFLFAS